MAKLSPKHTFDKRREFERKAAEACAEVAHVLIIDYLRGWNKATKKNIRLAKKALRKAYDLDPKVALAHLADGKIREVEGDLKGEVEALNEALAIDKDLLDAHAHMANAHILLGDAKEALAVLSKAPPPSRGDPELGLFDWFKGRAYFHLKDYDQAIYWLQKSIDERPTTWFSWAHLISAYALKGRLAQPEAKAALTTYRKEFLKDWPLDPKIRNYYKQPKYNGAYSELQAALKELFKGLEIAKEKADFP
jgi:tetratricopeptide (TPR) repeat protein